MVTRINWSKGGKISLSATDLSPLHDEKSPSRVRHVSKQTISHILVIATSIFIAIELSSLTSVGWFLVLLAVYWVYLCRRQTALRRASASGQTASRLVTLSAPVAFFAISSIFGASFIAENGATGMPLVSVPFLFGVYASYSAFFATIIWLVDFLLRRNRSSTPVCSK